MTNLEGVPDPSTYRPAPGTIPLEPGVYRFRDERGRVIYVGKAKSLRQRLNSYFADVSGLHQRTRQMVTTAASVEWTVVRTEVEALQLEYTWIKEFDPRFNVRYRDDKSYPSLAVTLYEEYPRLQVMRGPKRKGVRYFGPYSHAWAIRETLDLLLRVFPARTCSAGVFKRAGQVGRPCLLGYIDKCSAPCVGRVSADEHRQIVDDFCDFMAGKTDSMMRRLEKQMAVASANLEFELAARLRDDLGALQRAMEKQAVVFGDGTDADVVAFAEDELEAAVQVFHVRGGRVRGQRGWVVDRLDEMSTGDLVEQFITQFYGLFEDDGSEHPARGAGPGAARRHRRAQRMAVRAARLAGAAAGAAARRQAGAGRDGRPQRRAVADPAQAQARLRPDRPLAGAGRAARGRSSCPTSPLRIECFDISHVQGTNVVASMVVFEDGLARKSDYRRFAMREGTGDTDWIAEVVRRRFARYLDEQVESGADADSDPGAEAIEPARPGIDPTTGPAAQVLLPAQPARRRRRRAPGRGGQGRARRARASTTCRWSGWPSGSKRCGCPDQPYPVILPRTSEGLYLLQRVRDEAHRFAITYHRQKRSKAMTTSALDGIAGLGETRRKALMRRFGSIKRLRAATVDDIVEVPGIGRRTAETIVAALAAPSGTAPAVNMTTGEVLADD